MLAYASKAHVYKMAIVFNVKKCVSAALVGVNRRHYFLGINHFGQRLELGWTAACDVRKD